MSLNSGTSCCWACATKTEPFELRKKDYGLNANRLNWHWECQTTNTTTGIKVISPYLCLNLNEDVFWTRKEEGSLEMVCDWGLSNDWLQLWPRNLPRQVLAVDKSLVWLVIIVGVRLIRRHHGADRRRRQTNRHSEWYVSTSQFIRPMSGKRNTARRWDDEWEPAAPHPSTSEAEHRRTAKVRLSLTLTSTVPLGRHQSKRQNTSLLPTAEQTIHWQGLCHNRPLCPTRWRSTIVVSIHELMSSAGHNQHT